MGCAASAGWYGAARYDAVWERCNGAIATICPDKEGTDSFARPKTGWVVSGWIRSVAKDCTCRYKEREDVTQATCRGNQVVTGVVEESNVENKVLESQGRRRGRGRGLRTGDWGLGAGDGRPDGAAAGGRVSRLWARRVQASGRFTDLFLFFCTYKDGRCIQTHAGARSQYLAAAAQNREARTWTTMI